MRSAMRWVVLAAAAVGAWGCVPSEVMPQLVRSYAVDWPNGVGPDGKALSPQVLVLVANAPYLRDQCANQLGVGGTPLHAGESLAALGCIRISPEGRAEIVVPDTNEQSAVAHQLEHLRGRWCHGPQDAPVPCPR